MKSRAVAYTAVFSALALAIVALTHYLIPAKTVPIALVSVVGLITFHKVGWGGGIAFVAVVEILSFILTGLSITFFTLSVLFMPYVVYAFAIRKLEYRGKTAILRGVITLGFFYVTSIILMALALLVTGENSVLYEVQAKIGIYLTALLFAVMCVPADFFISQVAVIVVERLNKRIK